MVASTKRLRRADATVHYFEADGYYARDDPVHRHASRWYGKAAQALGLHGPVKPKRFAQVLQGFVPGTAVRLGRLREGEHQHQPGLDVTFSAPKSISVEALVYAPAHTRARLLNAHDEAVRDALDVLEGELLQTRGYDPATGRRPRVPAHGMVAATFRHIVSRNLDPQVHTHSVVANMTRDARGRWRSAEFTATERSRKLLGAAYRAALQRRVEAMGYATVPTAVGGMPGFEIAGFAKALLAAFSTRRRDLLAYLSARGRRYTAAAAQQATLYTRRAKQAEPDREVLAGVWRQRAGELGAARDTAIARGRGDRAPSPRATLSTHALVWRAMEHLEERHSVFAADALRAFALAHGAGAHGLDAIDAEMNALRRDGHLVEATAKRADRAFATARTLAAERRILRAMREGLDDGAALAKETAVAARLDAGPLNAGQREAVRTVLLSSHRLVGVQGYAGTGKTSMLREVCALADALVVGLAPSASAARVLERETGIAACTLQRFLTRYRDVGDGLATPKALAQARAALGGALVVLDESSMVSTLQMAALLRIADALGVARLALVGDRSQLRAVEAGAPFALLQKAGIPTARMDEVLRQRDPALKRAVLHLIAERPGLALEELGSGVIELSGDAGEEEPDDPPLTAARLWLDLDAGAREGTALLAPTHAQRARINAAVREGLAEEGVLHGSVLTIERYINLHLTRAQKADVSQYRAGDVAVFHAGVPPVRLRAGDACRVIGSKDSQVLLAHPDGTPRHIAPTGYIRYRLDLFETAPMELRAGDRIRWTRNAPHHGLVNGERARIAAIGAKRVRFESEDGRAYALARSDEQLHHLDHAYSSTVHAAQGMTCDAVIAVLDADHGPITDQARFYVELTRARDNVVLLTTDREALVEALETHSAEELSALEAIGAQFATPPAPAPGTLCEKAVHWPALVGWRAFAEAAHGRGEDPFDAEGHGKILAPILALADGDAAPQGLPEALAGVLAEHGARKAVRQRIEGVLGALDACLETRTVRLRQAVAAGRAVTALAGHAAWSRHVAAALGRARALRPEEAGRIEGAPERLAGTVAALERARDFDARTGALLGDWARHCEGARARGRPFLHRSGYAALHRRIEALSREATHPGELPPALARVLIEHAALAADRDAVRGELRTLREAAAARDALVDEALAEEKAVTQLARYAPWRVHVRDVCTTASRVRNAAEHQGARWRGIDAGRGRLGARLRALERALDYDATSQALLTALRADREAAATPPAPEQLDVAFLGRVRAHAHDATRPGELPPPLAAWLADRDTVHGAHEALRRCATTRAALLAEAVKFMRAVTDLDGYAPWRENSAQTLSVWKEVGTKAPRYRRHAEAFAGGWAQLASTAAALTGALERDGRVEALRTDWAEHARRALAQRRLPCDVEAGTGLVARLREFADTTPEPDEVPPWVVAVLTGHEAAAADRATARSAMSALAHCARDREALRAEAERTGLAITELAEHDAWRECVEAALARVRALLREEHRYRARLGSEETQAWERFKARAMSLERALGTDRQGAALLADWRAHETRPNATIPFYRQGYRELVARMQRLAGEAVRPGEVPPALARALALHRVLVADHDVVVQARQTVRACTTQRATLLDEAVAASGCAPTDLVGYPAWRKAAETALLHADAVVGDGRRYRAHVEGLGETWKDFAGAAQSLGRGLGYDDRARAVSRRCTQLEQRSDAAGIHPFYCRGFDALFQDVLKLFAEYVDRAEVPPQCISFVTDGPRRLAEVTSAALANSESTRSRLVRESRAQGTVLWEHERYAPWREHAVRARADAHRALAEAKRFAARLDKFEEWRAALTRATQTVDTGLDFDARGKALLERRRRHGLDAGRAAAPSDFYAPWYAGYIADAEELAPRAGDSAEIPAVLTRDLDAHAGSVLAQERAKACARALEKRARKRRALLETAAASRQALTQRADYAALRVGADAACAGARAMIDDEATYGPHLEALEGGRQGFVRSAEALRGAIALDERCAPCDEAWRAHHQGATAAGVHPMDHDGYAALVDRFTALDAEASGAGETRSPLAALLARHREYETDRDTVRRAREAIAPCAEERNTLLDDAHAAKRALTELDGYEPWRTRAREACALWTPLGADKERYRAHARGLGESWEDLDSATAALARGLNLDTRSRPVAEAWRACERDAAAAATHPLDHPGYEDVVGSMTALDVEATGADEARSPLAGLLARHAEDAADRSAFSEAFRSVAAHTQTRATLLNQTRAARKGVTSLKGYARWRTGAEKARDDARSMLDDAKRYSPHVTATGGSWRQFTENLHRLEASLAYDARSRSLSKELNAFGHEAKAARIAPLYFKGHDALLDRIDRHLRAARHPGEKSSYLTRVRRVRRVQEAERKRVIRLPSELEARLQERRSLLQEADAEGQHPAEHPDYPHWFQRRTRTLKRCRAVRTQGRYRAHVNATAQGGASFRKRLEELVAEHRRTNNLDASADALFTQWNAHREAARRARRHPFHHEGYEDVHARIAALAETAQDSLEIPRALREMLAQHPVLVADRDTVVAAARALDRRIQERHGLLSRAQRDGVHAPRASAYARWRQDVQQTLDGAGAILDDEPRYGPHGVALRDGMDELRRGTKELERALEVDGHADRLYRDWVQNRNGTAHTPDGTAVGRKDVDKLEQDIESLRARGLLPGELHPGVEAALERHRDRLETEQAQKRGQGWNTGYSW